MIELTLRYAHLHEYDPGQSGISVPIILALGERRAKVSAKLDTGSTFCVFEREIGEDLGLVIESGTAEWIATATGRFQAFGHTVALLVFDFQLEVTAYFTAQPNFGRNVLGRYGWMQQLRIGIVDYDGQLYVGRYDDAG